MNSKHNIIALVGKANKIWQGCSNKVSNNMEEGNDKRKKDVIVGPS
jgi:hypothetical protein